MPCEQCEELQHQILQLQKELQSESIKEALGISAKRKLLRGYVDLQLRHQLEHASGRYAEGVAEYPEEAEEDCTS